MFNRMEKETKPQSAPLDLHRSDGKYLGTNYLCAEQLPCVRYVEIGLPRRQVTTSAASFHMLEIA